jgi:hypothetical protein
MSSLDTGVTIHRRYTYFFRKHRRARGMYQGDR